MPYNFICVQTGSILSQINSMDDVFTIKTFIASLFVAIVVAIPTLLTKKIRPPIMSTANNNHLDRSKPKSNQN